MKFEILKWAYEAELPAAVKSGPHAVLIALAYSANFRTEACFPSIQRLAHLTRLKETAVKSGIKILKAQGLITVQSGKGKKKANRYTINYSKVEKKGASDKARDGQADSIVNSQPSDINSLASDINRKPSDINGLTSNAGQTRLPRQTETDSDYGKTINNQIKETDSAYAVGRNAATNQECTNLRTLSCGGDHLSINSQNSSVNTQKKFQKIFEDDGVVHHPFARLTYNYEGTELPLLLGRNGQKPIGLAKARKIVSDWFLRRGEQFFNRKLENMDTDFMATTLADAISMYTTPPDIRSRDIEELLGFIKSENDWVIFKDTIENVKKQACFNQINNPRQYILRSVEENVFNGTAEAAF